MFISSERIFGAAARLAALGLALAAGGCNTDRAALAPPPHPTDVRDRYPIKLAEAERAIEIYGGSGHGRLTATQRAEVAAFARAWRRESSGLLYVDVPAGVSAQFAVRQTSREVVSVLAAMGVPQAAIERRPYTPAQPTSFGPIRVAYPQVRAVAGPCGKWIDNIGSRLPFDGQRPVLELRLRQPAQPRRHGRQPRGPGAAARRGPARSPPAASRSWTSGARARIPPPLTSRRPTPK